MKAHELVELNRLTLVALSSIGIRTDDAEYIDLYKDYRDMQKKGDKYSYIIAFLIDKYKGVSESKIYRIIQKFEKQVRI